MDFTPNVKAGMALLDERERPGWWNRIDLDELNVGSCYVCVLAQLTVRRTETEEGTPFDCKRRELNITTNYAHEFGFTVDPPTAGIDTRSPYYGKQVHEAYELLTETWKQAIRKRQAEEAAATTNHTLEQATPEHQLATAS